MSTYAGTPALGVFSGVAQTLTLTVCCWMCLRAGGAASSLPLWDATCLPGAGGGLLAVRLGAQVGFVALDDVLWSMYEGLPFQCLARDSSCWSRPYRLSQSPSTML